jgi:protoporphyrin/coproporphyrin ferrochelatase
LLADRLELREGSWSATFQSRFGREEWLKPYTDATIRALGGSGLKRIDVVCPGFSADCLETLEEIAMQNAEFFHEAGGETLSYIPCLNSRPDHLDFLADLAMRHLQGWPEASPGQDTAELDHAAKKTRERAELRIAAREAGELG